MTQYLTWLNDSDGGAIPDDVTARLVLDLPDEKASREFWARILDLTAAIGLHTTGLPLPLVYSGPPHSVPGGVELIRIESLDQLRDLMPSVTMPEQKRGAQPVSTCLTKLFTIDGALTDRDGDLVADGTRIAFDLPEEVPAVLGAALANLAARIGLESGGIDLPLARLGPARFDIDLASTPATLAATGEGWLASGDPDELALLINSLAEHWPHITVPESGGVGYSLGWLRRALAGDGPEPRPAGQMAWELQWSSRWEVDQLWTAFSEQLFGRLDPDRPLKLTVLASEPKPIRQAFARRIERALEASGFRRVQVDSICTFKCGLSWLREVVLPASIGQQVERLRIGYKRFQPDDEALDRPTRWLQELFPGDEIMARDLGIELDAIDIVERPDQVATYTAEAFDAGGTSLGQWEFSPLSRTMPFVRAIPDSGTVCVTTSGLIAEQNGQRFEIPVGSDLESFWTFWQGEIIPRLLRQIDERGGPRTRLQPFFERLEAEVWISEPNSRLDIREENDSAAEALHEDIYFNTLDAIEMYGERQTGERTSAPGAVIPMIRVTRGGSPHARVRLFEPAERSGLPFTEVSVRSVSLRDGEFLLDVLVEHGSEQTLSRLIQLAGLAQPSSAGVQARVTCGETTVELRLPLQEVLSPTTPLNEAPTMHRNLHGSAVHEVSSRLAACPEVTAWVEDHSYQNRPIVVLSLAPAIAGRLRSPAKLSALKPTCLIVARHHANEISSTNAAFQLAYLCANDSDWREIVRRVNIIILPYENPDGAALHARLTSDPAARHWKHHPARYNALGYEFSEAFFDPNTPFGESRVRPALWRRFLPDAIVDNHGVPSHEWVQPFAGFGSPPRFRVSYWIPQALLYGIIGYVESDDYTEHRRMAKRLRDAVSNAVRDTDIGSLNDEIGRSYRKWGQERDPERFPGVFHNGMLWHIAGAQPNPEGRGFATRFPRTTVLNWVTEVNDETAEGGHLERTARAHLIANRAMLDLVSAAAQVPEAVAESKGGSLRYRWRRKRPLEIGKLPDE